MDISLIITLLLLLLFASALYYYFFMKRVPDVFHLGKSALVIIVFMIIPILVTVLYYQAGAKDRLNAIGFTPHSSFSSSVGVASGTGENPIWMFATESDKELLVDFYKHEKNYKEWKLSEENDEWLVYTKDNKKMRININNDTVLFMMSPKK